MVKMHRVQVHLGHRHQHVTGHGDSVFVWQCGSVRQYVLIKSINLEFINVSLAIPVVTVTSIEQHQPVLYSPNIWSKRQALFSYLITLANYHGNNFSAVHIYITRDGCSGYMTPPLHPSANPEHVKSKGRQPIYWASRKIGKTHRSPTGNSPSTDRQSTK